VLGTGEILGCDGCHADHDAIGILRPIPDGRVWPTHHIGVPSGQFNAGLVKGIEDVNFWPF
jgi:hypothetical protein